MKILMVCLGNICRSPLAEGILKSKIQQHGLNWKVDSAGTGSWHIDETPDQRSVKVAQDHDLDITMQKGRQISKKDFKNFDLIFVMDQENFKNVTALASTEEEKEKVNLIMSMLNPHDPLSVPDPYWDDNGFQKVYEMLDQACEAIIEKYK